MTPSKTLFYLCISFVVGIALSSIIKIPQIFVWGIFVFGIVTIFTSFSLNRSNSVIFGFCILVFVLALMRFQITEFAINNDALKKLNDRPEKITLIGQISGEPDVRDIIQKLKVTAQKLIVGGQDLSVKGAVLVTINSGGDWHYLDTVKVTGKLKTPVAFDDFNYKNYLLKDKIYSVIDYPRIELISTKHQYTIFSFLYEKILFFKEKLRQSIDASFSRPQSLILEGIMLGNNKTMPQDLTDKLNATGLRYLTAISGVHVIIVSAMLMTLFLMLGFWRQQAFYFSVSFIWLYIVLTGFTASGIRAAIMGSVFLLAQKFGRQNSSARTITLAAAIMLFLNPLLLRYDIGFQLSFLASFGIIYFKPLLENIINMVTKENFHALIDMISVTITAQIFILPVMVYNFGNMSLVAPITSILALPVIPWIMVSGFLASVLGMVSNILGWIFMLPCWLLLVYFLKILEIFSGPWALLTVKNVSWVWLAGYYMVLIFLIHFLQKYQKPKFLGY